MKKQLQRVQLAAVNFATSVWTIKTNVLIATVNMNL